MAEKSQQMLRAQAAVLLSQTQAQSLDIHRALMMVQGNPELRARLASLAADMDGVASQLSSALGSSHFPLRMGDLMSIAAVVQSGEANALVSQATAQAGSVQGTAMATAAQVAEVNAASTDARHEAETLSRDLFDKHIFDSYLRFSSAQDEEEFRRREAEAKRYIAEQLALGTPTGNLNASGGELGFMLDAHAHGAGDSPDFMPKWNALVAKTQRLHAALKASGQPTTEYDGNIKAAARRFLEKRGVPAAEIEMRLAGDADPLEVVNSILEQSGKGNKAADKDSSEQAGKPLALPPVKTSSIARMPDAPAAKDLDALGAGLAAAGMTLDDSAEPTTAQTLPASKLKVKGGASIAVN